MNAVKMLPSAKERLPLQYRRAGEQTVLQGELPIPRVDRIDEAVLSRCPPPYLVSLRMQVHGSSMELEYRTGMRKPLNEWLRFHEVTEAEGLQFLLHVTHTLNLLRDHWLIENRCLLSPEQIYVQEQLLDARFIYWPDSEVPSSESALALGLQKLGMEVVRTNREARFIRKFIHYCDDPMFTLAGLRRRLIAWNDQIQHEVSEMSPPQSAARPGRMSARKMLHHLLERLSNKRGSAASNAKSSPALSRDEIPHSIAAASHTRPLTSAGEAMGGGRKHAALIIEHDHKADQRIEITSNPFLIGRDRRAVNGCCDHPLMSRIHAEIKCIDGEWFLRDLGSSNGTYVNGQPLVPYTPVRLQHHDRITFADLSGYIVME